MFDYEKLIEKYGISPDVVKDIIDEAKNEFPNDEMMVELHVIRAVRNYITNSLKAG